MAPPPPDSFELAGAPWTNMVCGALFLFVVVPGGAMLARAGLAKRRLWLRARARRYDDRRLARAAARLGLGEDADFEDAARLGRFRARWPFAGVSDVVLGAVCVVGGVAALTWLWCGEPERVRVTAADLVVDYRWPRPDRRVPIGAVAGVNYYTQLGTGRRGGTTRDIELRVSLRDGDTVQFRTPRYRGNDDALRAAGAALAARAGVALHATVERGR